MELLDILKGFQLLYANVADKWNAFATVVQKQR